MLMIDRLSKREQQVVKSLMLGKLDKEIAHELEISHETVRKHNKNIYKKLNVRNRTELVIMFQRGIVK